MKDELTYEEFKRFMDTWQFEKCPYIEEKLVPDLYKLTVVGYVVVKSTSTGNKKETIHTYPIISSDGFSNCNHAGYDLHPDEELISVIPCSVKTFKVCGYTPNATPEEIMSDNFGLLEPVVLGYEHEGLPPFQTGTSYSVKLVPSGFGVNISDPKMNLLKIKCLYFSYSFFTSTSLGVKIL